MPHAIINPVVHTNTLMLCYGKQKGGTMDSGDPSWVHTSHKVNNGDSDLAWLSDNDYNIAHHLETPHNDHNKWSLTVYHIGLTLVQALVDL